MLPEAPNSDIVYLCLFAALLFFVAAIVAAAFWAYEYTVYLDDLDRYDREETLRRWAAHKAKMEADADGK